MPTLDVSHILYDPRFSQSFEIARTIRMVSPETGVCSTQRAVTPSQGVVNPLGEDAISRMPESDRNNSYITVWTQDELRTGTEYQLPDEVIYHGTSWRVERVQDWSAYGAGFYKALCVQQYDSEEGDY